MSAPLGGAGAEEGGVGGGIVAPSALARGPAGHVWRR